MRRIDQFRVFLRVHIMGDGRMCRPTSNPASLRTNPAARVSRNVHDRTRASPIEAQNPSHHIRIEEIQRYKLSEESFEAYVLRITTPTGGRHPRLGERRNRGAIPRGMAELMDKHRLVFHLRQQQRNERGLGVRSDWQWDAVHNLENTIHVDPARITRRHFGSGKVAPFLPIIYPEFSRARFPWSVFRFIGAFRLKMTRSAAGHDYDGRRLSCTIALAN